MKMDILRLKEGLKPTIFSENMVFLSSVGSTNQLAKEMAAAKAPEGTVVLADEQTAGRGRRGRGWMSASGENLLFSVVLRPGEMEESPFVLTMGLALAGVEGVQAVTGMVGQIKWPNDLYLGSKKMGGILTECVFQEKAVEFVILGLGLNVNWNPSNRHHMPYETTSLLKETKKPVEREELLTEVLFRFGRYYREVALGRAGALYQRWHARSMLLGRDVVVRTNGRFIEGKVIDIERDGTLVLMGRKGKNHRIICGDVSVKEVRNETSGEPEDSQRGA